MQKKQIATKWIISSGKDHQAIDLVKLKMPRKMQLADKILRIFGRHLDIQTTHAPFVSGEEKELSKALAIPLLYKEMTDENKFEIYRKIFEHIQKNDNFFDPSYYGLLNLSEDTEIHQGDIKYKVADILASHRFIAYFYMDATVSYNEDKCFDLKDLKLLEGIESGLFKNGLYIWQFFKDEKTGITKLKANEIDWNNTRKQFEVRGKVQLDIRENRVQNFYYEPELEFRLIPPN